MPEVKFAAEQVFEEDEDLTLWHSVSETLEVDKVPYVHTVCGLRFRPIDVITEDRTLIDWGNEDDLCGCAAFVPTPEQCKEAGIQLRMGGQTMTESNVKKALNGL
jgi:hypothetical protein